LTAFSVGIAVSLSHASVQSIENSFTVAQDESVIQPVKTLATSVFAVLAS
jgi:hypothetical protein